MNCEVMELPVLVVEEYQVREVMRCLLHTLLFHRALGSVRPRDVDSELFEITYVQCGCPGVESCVEEKINELCHWIARHPNKRATVLVSFYEKRMKQNWFAKQEERLYWEQWRVHLEVGRPSTSSREGNNQAQLERHIALEESLQAALFTLLGFVNVKKEHIPPVVSSDIVCFPYEITLPSETDSHIGLDMFKRVVMNSNPPTMLN
mmetsp:Transcript_22826/g.31801  ORF Transcript_22826/g.31801 Transcript_22826/m.31801 type:complete len:206 (+) Transcript_22826:69-686(+)|eukprot:CAMPEP_0196588256 /NCGR_PEP_ID=MMETSP1081-20130531/60006_1 /TAXON_ID=36882 /ORGANISM="Pyramimonas amylifera, Strain CCMP720" /LENGTH=205 /DNA_ID=CAMNT_0041910703 /DNA_START=88 /DNA_END=705 /DNA_ORIENTATION=-